MSTIAPVINYKFCKAYLLACQVDYCEKVPKDHKVT